MLPGRSPELVLGNKRVIIFKNVVVVPENFDEEDETTEDDGIVEGDAIVEEHITTEGDEIASEKDDDGDEVLEDDVDGEEEQAEKDADDTPNCEDHMGSFEEEDAGYEDSNKGHSETDITEANSMYSEVEAHSNAGLATVSNDMVHSYLLSPRHPAADEDLLKTNKQPRADDNEGGYHSVKISKESAPHEQTEEASPMELYQFDSQAFAGRPTHIFDLNFFDQ